jgi:hypothetical protein
MTDLAAIATSLISRDAFLSLCNESQVFGAKKKADRAFELWQSASSRRVLAYQAVRVPGGSGTGLMAGIYWDPAIADPDFAAIGAAVGTELPRDLIRDDEKATWKTRDGKQNIFFIWRGMRERPLSQWFRERFGVEAMIHQVMSPANFEDNVAIEIVVDGVDRVWPLSLPA